MKVLVGTFNQEKALVGAFSVIVKTDGSFAAVQKRLDTSKWTRDGEPPDPSPSRAPAKLISPGHKKLVAGCLQIQ